MKSYKKKLLVVFLFIFGNLYLFSQETKIKIYQNKTVAETCAIVFPNSPEPLIVVTSKSGCKEEKSIAIDEWAEIPSGALVTVTIEKPLKMRESPSKSSPAITKREAASGLPTGKRQHEPIRIYKEVCMEKLGGDLDGDGVEVYKFSWKVEEGIKLNNEQNSEERVLETISSNNGCCSNGECSVVVSVDKKHTKSGHVTLLK